MGDFLFWVLLICGALVWIHTRLLSYYKNIIYSWSCQIQNNLLNSLVAQ